MTSFTKALYRRDPAAAEAFHRQSSFESRATNGRPGLLLATFASANPVKHTFGKRETPPSAVHACKDNCGHPACSQGCTLFVTHDPVKHPELDREPSDSVGSRESNSQMSMAERRRIAFWNE
jgi:hypothetical protein